MKTWSPDVVLFTNGTAVHATGRQRLARNGVAIEMTPLTRLEHQDGELRRVHVRDGEPVPCDALFFTTSQRPQCDLAVRLGCAFDGHGAVRTGRLSETNVAGVFVAGDASHDAQFVVVAAAEGVKAALAINQALQKEELRP
jgi:thioredoxin reductase